MINKMTKNLEIKHDLFLKKDDYNDCIYIEYTNYSNDHWHSNDTRSVDIDKEKAIEIVRFLTEIYEL